MGARHTGFWSAVMWDDDFEKMDRLVTAAKPEAHGRLVDTRPS